MRFATLVLIGAVAAVHLRRGDRDGGDRDGGDHSGDDHHSHGDHSDEPMPTGAELVNWCDQDGDLSLSLMEAQDCFRAHVHDEIDAHAAEHHADADLMADEVDAELEAHWEFIAGEDMLATADEIDAAMTAHEADALAQIKAKHDGGHKHPHKALAQKAGKPKHAHALAQTKAKHDGGHKHPHKH